jgi:hypothetical protein
MSIECHEKGRKKMSIGGSVTGPAQKPMIEASDHGGDALLLLLLLLHCCVT